jgi:hypothetical protein
MYISLLESYAKGFRKWSDAHPPAANDDAGDLAKVDALVIPPEAARDPWLVPGVGNSSDSKRRPPIASAKFVRPDWSPL